jgi:hypothetical protein
MNFMDMKNIILVSFLSVLSISSFSQDKRIYVSFGGGYALSTTQDAIGKSSQTFSNGDYVTTNIYGTYGKGIPVTLRGGMKVNEKLAFELGASYLLGTSILTDKGIGTATETNTKVKGTQIRVLPSVVFSGKNVGLHLYGRVGLVLPVGSKYESVQTTSGIDIGGNASETIERKELTNAFSIGYFGALGVNLKIKDNMFVFGEVEHVSLRMKQKTSVLTELSINGADQSGTFTTQRIETIYVDEITSSDNTKIDEPLKLRAQTVNFGTVGLNLGVKYLF